MKRKFCWLPTPVYSSRYYRCGYRWFKWVWIGDDGKHYIANIEKIKARFNSDGVLLYLYIPAGFDDVQFNGQPDFVVKAYEVLK